MTKFSKISLDGISENQVLRSDVTKTQQPGAEGLNRFSEEPYVLISCMIFCHQNDFLGTKIILISKADSVYQTIGFDKISPIKMILMKVAF